MRSRDQCVVIWGSHLSLLVMQLSMTTPTSPHRGISRDLRAPSCTFLPLPPTYMIATPPRRGGWGPGRVQVVGFKIWSGHAAPITVTRTYTCTTLDSAARALAGHVNRLPLH